MDLNPTQLVIDHLTREPATLRDAQRRLTLAAAPACLRDRIEHALRRARSCGYLVAHNERVIRTNPRLGALRRALVQWAARHAPADVAGFQGMLTWSLVRVDWPDVIRCVTATADESVSPSVQISHIAGFAHTGRRGMVATH